MLPTLKPLHSPNTKCAYRRRCADFDAWHAIHHINTTDDTTLAAYLRHLFASGKASTTVAQAAAAVCFRAKVNDRPSPSGRKVASALKRIALEGTHRGRGQSDAITVEMYERMLERIQMPRKLRDGAWKLLLKPISAHVSIPC